MCIRDRYTAKTRYTFACLNIARPAADARPDQLQKRVLPALFHRSLPPVSPTGGAPRNHTNVPPVDAHVWRQLFSYVYQLSLVVATATNCIFYFLFHTLWPHHFASVSVLVGWIFRTDAGYWLYWVLIVMSLGMKSEKTAITVVLVMHVFCIL